MASAYVASLIIARDNFALQLAALSAGPPKPSYSVDGESYSWESYVSALTKRIDDLNISIAKADGGFDVSHHAEVIG